MPTLEEIRKMLAVVEDAPDELYFMISVADAKKILAFINGEEKTTKKKVVKE